MDKAICGYLVEACRKLNQEEFNLQSLALVYGCLTVSDWADKIERAETKFKVACIEGFENTKAYFSSKSNGEFWAAAEVVFNQSMNQARYGPQSGPVSTAADLLHELSIYSNKRSVLLADLLPKLIELDQFDLQMQAVFRRRWTSIDSIMDGWYRADRKDRCAVPHW